MLSGFTVIVNSALTTYGRSLGAKQSAIDARHRPTRAGYHLFDVYSERLTNVAKDLLMYCGLPRRVALLEAVPRVYNRE